jgi:hypothetical protein
VTANLPVAVGDEATADLLNEISGMDDSASFLLTTSASPLTTTANTAAIITSGSYDFVSGYAYEMTITCRFTTGGGSVTATAERTCVFSLSRATAAGTKFYNSGRVEVASSNAVHFHGSQVVKVTAGDTTQTICFNGEFDNGAGVVANTMAITTNGSTTPARLTIKRIGMAANHADAIELPTS